MAPWGSESSGRGGLFVEVEVSGRALLEPQTIVVRGVLKELGRLLEHVLALLLGLGVLGMLGMVEPDVVLGRLLVQMGRGIGGIWRAVGSWGRLVGPVLGWGRPGRLLTR